MTERRNGRPPVGPQIKIAFPPGLLALIDEQAGREGVSRSAWVRIACEANLAQSLSMSSVGAGKSASSQP